MADPVKMAQAAAGVLHGWQVEAVRLPVWKGAGWSVTVVAPDGTRLVRRLTSGSARQFARVVADAVGQAVQAALVKPKPSGETNWLTYGLAVEMSWKPIDIDVAWEPVPVHTIETFSSWYSLGVSVGTDTVNDLAGLQPNLKTPVSCPACPAFEHQELPVWKTIVHLNDQHVWSRDQIADWLDTLPIDLALNNPAGSGH